MKAQAESPNANHIVLQMTNLARLVPSGPLVLTEADGLRVRDQQGKWYLDCMAGLYNVNVGYGREELAAVAATAMQRLSYGSSFFGRTTDPSLRLADKLSSITPKSLSRFIFTVGGSDAIDTAIKLIRHHNVLAGFPEKMTVIARHGGYHGMTFGGTTATGQPGLREGVGPLLPGVLHIDQPGPSGDVSARELEEAILREGPETVACFLAEPVALTPGIAVPPHDYWPAIRAVCSRYGVRLVVDEVVTGFGRTGRMFACEHWNLEPDLMVLSKGITSGYLPLGAVGMSEEIFEGLCRSKNPLPHGFTAGGHPVCCEVALANIAIIEREELVDQAARVGQYLERRLSEVSGRYEMCGDVRSLGMIAGLDVSGESGIGDWVTEEMRRNGVLVRNYGNTIAFGPPLIATECHIDVLVEQLDATLQRL